jgi:hypothetical protein
MALDLLVVWEASEKIRGTTTTHLKKFEVRQLLASCDKMSRGYKVTVMNSFMPQVASALVLLGSPRFCVPTPYVGIKRYPYFVIGVVFLTIYQTKRRTNGPKSQIRESHRFFLP